MSTAATQFRKTTIAGWRVIRRGALVNPYGELFFLYKKNWRRRLKCARDRCASVIIGKSNEADPVVSPAPMRLSNEATRF